MDLMKPKTTQDKTPTKAPMIPSKPPLQPSKEALEIAARILARRAVREAKQD
jgi:hypothetical protein